MWFGVDPMRGTQNLLWIFLGCTFGATSVQGQSEALPICNPNRTVADAPCVDLPSEISAEFPEFSKLAVEATRGGDVVLSVSISQAGIPEEIEVAKSRGKEFDEEAIAAFRQCRFKPTIYKNESRAIRGTARLYLICHTYRGLMTVPTVSDYTPAEGKGAKQWKGSLEACGGPSSPLRHDPKWMKKHNCAPVLINRIPIDVPGASKQAEMWGSVVLSVTIREDGTVGNAGIIKAADEELNRLALANAQESGTRFTPAMYKGRPIAVRAKLEVRFWTCDRATRYWGLGP
jgi:TonB family protein